MSGWISGEERMKKKSLSQKYIKEKIRKIEVRPKQNYVNKLFVMKDDDPDRYI